MAGKCLSMKLILGKALRNAAESSVSISRVTQTHGVSLTAHLNFVAFVQLWTAGGGRVQSLNERRPVLFVSCVRILRDKCIAHAVSPWVNTQVSRTRCLQWKGHCWGGIIMTGLRFQCNFKVKDNKHQGKSFRCKKNMLNIQEWGCN